MIPSNLWHSWLAVDWRAVRVIAVMALAASALVWAGLTLVGVGEFKLGCGAIVAGIAALLVASQEQW